MHRLNDEKQNMHSKIELLNVKTQEQETQILQMHDQLKDASYENSKLMVSGNQNAKVQHFTNVKM